jgi:steroid 5-alpha reductase family enzyme
MLDTRSRARRPAFDDYANRTSALIPLPPRSS